MMPALAIYDLAKKLLAAVVDYYQGENVELPERRFVCPYLPILDCEQLTVHVERTFSNEGDPAVQVIQSIGSHPGHGLRTAVFVIALSRCVPLHDMQGDSIVLPPIADEEAAAAQIHADGVHLFNAVLVADKNGDLGGCDLLAILEWISAGNEAGLAGGALRVWIGLS